MMAKKSIQTWDITEPYIDITNPDVEPNEMIEEKSKFISIAIENNKTDGVVDDVNEYETIRYWVDQTAAEEWASFITQLATSYNAKVTVNIQDNN